MADRLSSIISMLPIPDRIMRTLGKLAQNRSAAPAGLSPPRAASSARAAWGGPASLPPFTGSMTMTGLLCFTHTS